MEIRDLGFPDALNLIITNGGYIFRPCWDSRCYLIKSNSELYMKTKWGSVVPANICNHEYFTVDWIWRKESNEGKINESQI